MKLAFITNSLGMGGAEKLSAQWIEQFSKTQNLEVYLLENESWYSIPPSIKTTIFTQFTRKTFILFKLLALPVTMFRLFFKLRKQNPDVVVSALELSNIVTLVIAKCLLRKKVILWIHTNPIEQYKGGLFNKFITFVIRYGYKKADSIVVITSRVKDILHTQFKIPSTKIIHVNNAHLIKQYQINAKEKISVSDKKLFSAGINLVTVGRSNNAKGHWHLVRAFSIVSKQIPNVKLYIIGEGELLDQTKQLAKNLELSNILFLGNKKNPLPYVAEADYFILSSLWEGMPNTLIEALAIGITPISTNCKTGPSELLAQNELINKYPYYGINGILTTPFAVDQPNFGLEITEEEKIYAKELISILKSNKRYGSAVLKKRAMDFDTKNIYPQWNDLLKNTKSL